MFPIPQYLKLVVNLVCQMLQGDPLKRATIEEIKKHEICHRFCFLQQLKRIPLIPLPYAKFGVKEQEVHNAHLNGDPRDELVIAYHLIIKNTRFADEAAKTEIKNFIMACSTQPVAHSLNDHQDHNLGGSSSANSRPGRTSMNRSMKPHTERIAHLCEHQLAMAVQAKGGGDFP